MNRRKIVWGVLLSVVLMNGVGSCFLCRQAGGADGGKKKPKPKPPPSADAGGGEEDGGGGGGGDLGKADGFGEKATGGNQEVRVSSVSQLSSAVGKSGSKVILAAGDYDCGYDQITLKSNVTLDGGGATLYFPGSNHNGKGVNIYGQNVIIRNIHIRNSGDNLGLGGSSFSGTKDVLIEHVSCTGSGDDNFSIAYKCSDVTMRYCLGAGGNRNVFYKYGGHNLTIHHSILTRAWIRNPLNSGSEATIDFRNNLVSHWKMWGTRVESGAKGNFVNNTWILESWAGGKSDSALYSYSGGQFYASGNTLTGCSMREGASKSPLVDAPKINGETDAKTALAAVMDERNGAGCMPRDAIDKAYLTIKQTAPGGDGAVGLVVPEAQRKKGK